MTTVLKASLVTTVLAAALSVPAGAQDAPRERLVVSAEWLAEHLDDPNLLLLHVGPEEDYAEEHIPGARYVSHRQIASGHEHGALILELPDPPALQETLRGLGINDDSRIVVYWGGEWVSPATRVIFTLQWAGLGDRTVLLDGGIDAWKAAGHPVTAEAPAVRPGSVTVRLQSDLVVTADWVEQHRAAPGYQLVDGRARAFYDGVREDRGKGGHIPGAGSLPWVELFGERDYLKDPGALRALLVEAGVEEGETVVAYCHIGQYATAVIFAARTLGYDVKLYDGAWQDWAARDLPVATP